MPSLTLGISPCPNDVYIFSGLLLGQVPTNGLTFTVDFQDVETLNDRAQSGAIDVVKISYANYVHCQSQYGLLDCGGALGRGVGPLLLSHGGVWNPDAEVLVPGEYTTANFLLDFYAGRPLQKRFLPFDALYAELLAVPGAQGVVIHEKRFTYAADGLHLIQDLGDHWERETNFAIPLGAIAARRTWDKAHLEAIVQSSLRWAYAHDAEAFALCREYSQDLNPDVVRAHIQLYVNSFSEHIGPEGRAAVQFFLQKQQEYRGQMAR
jgi:1,4-dihydroxy-6-naphthoate synthase